MVLLLAASDVTLLQVKVPPLSGARLKAALPGLVEEQVLGDPADCVLVAGARVRRRRHRAPSPWCSAPGSKPIVKPLLAQGARARVGAAGAAVPAAGAGQRVAAPSAAAKSPCATAQFQGLGLALAGADPAVALQTARALAGDAPLTLYVPPAQLGEYQALAAEAGPGITLRSRRTGRTGSPARTPPASTWCPAWARPARARADWKRWRWPLRAGAAGAWWSTWPA